MFTAIFAAVAPFPVIFFRKNHKPLLVKIKIIGL
jgi:hypothetical protein